MEHSYFIGLVIVIFIIGTVILAYRFQSKEDLKRIEKAFTDLGFVNDQQPNPRHLKQLASLRPNTKPLSMLRKQLGDANMYAYTLFLTEDPDKFQIASLYQTVAIISPSLRLPRFTISPSWKNLDRMSPKDMKQIDKSDEFEHAFHRVERVWLGIDKTYENYHLIQSAEKDSLQDFLTRDRIQQLNAMNHQYDIRCNDSSFSIDFLPWDQRPENYLKRASEDAEIIYKIFVDVLP